MPPASRNTAQPALSLRPRRDRRTRRAPAWILTGTILAGTLTILSLWRSGILRTAPRPDVLLISVDTLRVDHLGLAGYDRPTSPEIDSLGQSGLFFSQAICQNTNTNPSHASILSGLYPRTHGSWDNFYMMNQDVVLLPQVFRRAGYKTAAFVSGYTLKSKICALDRGFDTYDDRFNGRERRGDQTTDLALRWMKEHAAEPFFMWVHLFDPHGPYDPPAGAARRFEPRRPPLTVPLERIPRYQRLPVNAPDGEIWTDLHRYEAGYDGEIAFADAQVGRLLEALKGLALEKKTIVLLTSDHGEALTERFHLLDHGGGIGDEEIRVPIIIRLPDGGLAGTRYDGQVESIDIAPTLLAAAGLGKPREVQGVDLLALVRQNDLSPHPVALTETRVIPFRWRDRDYALRRDDSLKAVRTPDAKLVVFPGVQHNYLELYDLEQDPAEKHDTHLQNPSLTRIMTQHLDQFLRLPARYNQTASPDTDSETKQIFCTLGYADCAD